MQGRNAREIEVMVILGMDNRVYDKSVERWEARLAQRDRNLRWLKERLFEMDYPALYLGDEMNTFHFDWDRAIREKRMDQTFRILLANMAASGDTFSAPAIPLFYELLHDYDPDWVIERSLCPPAKRNRELMKADGISPFAVESKMPLTAFDCICLSLGLSSSVVSVPWILLESDIPVYYRDRSEDDPFIILGGSVLVNPGPFQPMCDILFFGEGEEILPELLKLLAEGRKKGLSREDILLRAAKRWDCLYVPRFYEERYHEDGTFAGTHPLHPEVPKRIQFSRIHDLDKSFVSTRPFLDFSNNVRINSHYEISRGCEGKCSFCMHGFTTLPFRPRSAERVAQILDQITKNTGNLFVSPVSFNLVSHPEINRIIRDIIDNQGERVRLFSMRMDGFAANPELCCFISMQERGRIVFGVEGASERLRNLVSKNLSEEQILDTMRMVSKNGYRNVKLMLICGFPTEGAEDLEELYQLAVKIRGIFEEEKLPEEKIPRLLISWTVLQVTPHTPLQWAAASERLSEAYEEFAVKIRNLGFRTYVPEINPKNRMIQLFLRGDSRIASLLVYLAEEGCLCYGDSYEQEVLDRTIGFLSAAGLPPLSEWFREYGTDEALPWDIIESPASREYLLKRYQSIKEKMPVSDPVCSSGCSGCGGCGSEQKKMLRELPAKREEDRRIELQHPVKRNAAAPVQYILLEYDYDWLHSVVSTSYWDSEIRRALFQAEVSFVPESVESLGSQLSIEHTAGGSNVTNIALGSRYDLKELKQRIEDHAVNFHIREIREIPHPLRIREVTFSMQLPDGRDMKELSELVREKLSETEWRYEIRFPGFLFPGTLQLRQSVGGLEIEGNRLMITTGPNFAAPDKVYRYLFGMPDDEPLGQVPVRTHFEYEKQGILDRCKSREMRDAFLRHKGSRPVYDEQDFREMKNYISSSACVADLEKLISRDYRISPPHHYKVPKNLSGRKRDVYRFQGTFHHLLKLIAFAVRDYDNVFSDSLYSFRTSRTAQDILKLLRESESRSRCYIVKADISNYVGSIVPEKISPMLEKLWGDDPAFLDLLKFLLLRRECIEPNGEIVSASPGGLGGVPLSNLFMNVYLMELDEYYASRSPLYCRYSDDIIIFAESREEAKSYLDHFLQVLREKELSMNPEKTCLIEPGGEVEIMGCKLREGEIDISDHSIRKLKRKIRMHANYLLRLKRKNGIADEECGRQMADYCNRVFFGQNQKKELVWTRWLFPVITETASLKELDHYIQDAIRYCMCGTLSEKRYRITYQKLKSLGYRSLVHAYYHFEHS